MTHTIVIGGGIAGISAAARLSEHTQVTVLEAETALAYHASGRSAALFEQNYGAPTTIALNKASAQYHFEANGGYTSDRGLLILGRADEKSAFYDDLETMGVDQISPADALEMVPVLNAGQVAYAGFHKSAYDIDTDRMVQDFAKVVRANGGQVLTNTPVTAISHDGTMWQVQSGDKSYTCSHLVNAAGAWADVIATMAGVTPIGLQPMRRSMARIPAPGGHDVSNWPMFFGVGETWYAKPDAGALLVSPADEDPVEPMDAWPDDMVLAEGLARYEALVTTPVTRLLASWAGLRSFAPDRSLVLGRDPDVASFTWCAAQGGYGFQTAPAASQLVADLVLGRTPALSSDLVAQLAPARLR